MFKELFTNKSPMYYGWYIVATAMIIGFIGAGSRQGFGIFVVPMSEEFGWNRGTISFAASLGFLLNGVVQPFMGSFFDKLGGRKVILTCLLVLGITTLSLSFTFHILFLIFVFGVVSSCALSGVSITTTGALLSKWFRKRRATAVSISAAGMSLGGLILVPFSMYLLQATNWRVTWAVLGFMILGISLPMAIAFIRDDPEKMGLNPDGEKELSEGESKRKPVNCGPLEPDSWLISFKSAPIWQMSGSYFVCGATTGIISVHFVPHALQLGISPGRSAIIFGFMMSLNLVGAITAGLISDRFSRKNLLGLTYFLRGCGYALLVLIPGELSLWAFAAVAGLSWIATAPLTTALTADMYGLKALGTISGISFFFHAVGSFVSILLAGILYDVTGSYTVPFAIAGALLLPAALSAWTIRERKYSNRYASSEPVLQTAGG